MRKFIIVEAITNWDETLTIPPNAEDQVDESWLIDNGFTPGQLDSFMTTGRILETTLGFPPPAPQPQP